MYLFRILGMKKEKKTCAYYGFIWSSILTCLGSLKIDKTRQLASVRLQAASTNFFWPLRIWATLKAKPETNGESGIFQLHQQLNFSSFGNTFFAEISEYRYTAIQSMPSKLTPTRSGHYRLLQPLCKGFISSYAFSNCQQLTGCSLPTSI